MSVITPLLYQRLITDPQYQLERRLIDRISERVHWGPSDGQVDAFLASFLDPVAFSLIVRRGTIGVPLLTEEDLHGLGGDLFDGYAEEPTGRWWEFWRTGSGLYALFPADDDTDLHVTLAVVVATGLVVQLRRLDAGKVGIPTGELKTLSPPALEQDICVLEAGINDDGAPYDGHCADAGCQGGCTPQVFVYDDGIYRLQGCQC